MFDFCILYKSETMPNDNKSDDKHEDSEARLTYACFIITYSDIRHMSIYDQSCSECINLKLQCVLVEKECHHNTVALKSVS